MAGWLPDDELGVELGVLVLAAVCDAVEVVVAAVEAPEVAAVTPSETPNAAAVRDPMARAFAVRGLIVHLLASPSAPRRHANTPDCQPAGSGL